ncbi:MAG: TldD/PmbA family protein [Streptosporangiales bacterium]|nr:TldD/PmbA family protein [Streptosporangiales bacterium]
MSANATAGARHDIDPEFLALPLRTVADAAIQRARDLGASHAEVRTERGRLQAMALRDARLQTSVDLTDTGVSVRVLHDGAWGFAAAVDIDPATAQRLAEQAVELARTCKPLTSEPVVLADEPVHADVTWVSAYTEDPFGVPVATKIALLGDRSATLLAHPAVDHVDASFQAVLEQKFYADSAGTVSTQQRVRVHPELTAVTLDAGDAGFEDMRTLAPPTARGWEFVTGTGWDWATELAQLPDLLAERAAAPSVRAGRYDLVIDPSNLWLTIHESIGHGTELDRALGYEAAYAGTTFATFDQLGELRYGSPVMQVTGDRTAEHGLATVGYDDEGVATTQWDVVRDGVLVGYQLNRQMAAMKGLGASNGCAFADSAAHVPLQRMANVSLQPADDGPATDELIADVDDGLYVVGDKSWSIDMQRYNFQFTGQRVYAIRNGRLAGQVRDFAYQSKTPDFWGSMAAVGGPQTYVLGGTFMCGKGQPGQTAPVSHGCPSALFRGVNVLNTREENG